ncbi:DUF4214 domain-containing protein [Massilia rubra]|uniref:DUF4214 domain-containing protein n=1 Tax=Massilia rubra TaxID=2607910 RepID=A0ABX0LHJ9_9BURK|nr:DUF4214 domain-containing protein [Massilia rubra]NHZ33489.1 DUF4214 domain-containing protein [Massilia rubra]
MTYLTIDTLPDLSAAQMNSAPLLTFYPIRYDGYSFDWDESASFRSDGTHLLFNDVYYFNGIANIPYDISSDSARDPSGITVYDMAGNAIAVDRELGYDEAYPSDLLINFIAPYSGKFYVSAGWNQLSTNMTTSLTVYADMNRPAKAPQRITGNDLDETVGYGSSVDDLIDGGGGIDQVVFYNPRVNYTILRNGNTTSVTSILRNEGNDVLSNVEVLRFSDITGKTTFLDMTYVDLAESLYIGYFGRAADVGGLNSFQAQLAALKAPTTVSGLNARYGTDAALKSLVDSFGASAESNALYGGDNKSFVTAIYANVLNRAPDQGGLDFWSKAIDTGSLTRAGASLAIMAGAQSNNTPQGQADAQLLGVKINVASNFTYALDMGNLGGAYNGAGPAAAVRTMLGSLSASTDVLAFQPMVQQVIGKMAKLPGVQSPIQDLAPPDAGHAPVLLTGIDSSDNSAFLFA